MPIQVVTLVQGTETPVGDGVNRPVRAVIRFADQSVRAAIVKTMPPASVAAEVFCAASLRGWGLNVPEPALVVAPFAFASVDSGYPNLKQRIGWSESLPPDVRGRLEQMGARLVTSFPDTPLALAADEAIDNRDRNLGNILWDGADVAWIDHERALGIAVADADLNKLAIMAVMSGDHDRIRRSAAGLSLSLGMQAILDAAADCGAMPDSRPFASFVSARLSGLTNRLLARFPQPADLFNSP